MNMPRDVATRWNSTFDVLQYTLKHKEAVEIITQKKEMGLRQCELVEEEWEMLNDLCKVLKVRGNCVGVDRWWW
jgi:hypothetical protein